MRRKPFGRFVSFGFPGEPLVPGVLVELFPDPASFAEGVGKEIHKGNTEKGWVPRAGSAKESKHVKGQLGEMASSVFTGLPWAGSSQLDKKRADIGEETEVRTNTHDFERIGTRAPLVIYPADLEFKKFRAFILGYAIDASRRLWFFRGWMTPAEAVKHDEWKRSRYGDSVWEVPPMSLHRFPVPENRRR